MWGMERTKPKLAPLAVNMMLLGPGVILVVEPSRYAA